MVQLIRAVYEHGLLRLLDPVELSEGQTVRVAITPESLERELMPEEVDWRLRQAGLLLEMGLTEDIEELTLEERQRIGRLFIGERPSEALIDEERGAY